MTPTTAVAGIEPAARAESLRVDVYAPGANQPDALFSNPEQIGRAVMEAMDGFQARVGRMQEITHELVGGSTASGGATSADAGAAADHASAGVGQAGMPAHSPAAQSLQKEQQHMLGVMMETYDFALEASLVTRAATTFTSSVNTLIKAQ